MINWLSMILALYLGYNLFLYIFNFNSNFFFIQQLDNLFFNTIPFLKFNNYLTSCEVILNIQLSFKRLSL